MIGADRLVTLTSALLYIGLGVAVLLLRPRRRLNIAFSAYCILFGSAFVLSNVLAMTFAVGVEPAWTLWLLTGLHQGWAIAFISIGALLALHWGRVSWKPAGVALALSLAINLGYVASEPLVVVNADGVIAVVSFVLTLAVSFFLGLAHAALPNESDRRQVRIIALAILFFDLFTKGFFAMHAHVGTVTLSTPFFAFSLLEAVTLSGAWLYATYRAPPGAESRACRNIALLALALFAAGAAASILGISLEAENVARGLARMLGVLIFAYGILRYQLFGLDVRIRLGIRRSTVAAAFVGVFFVVSEAAATYFTVSIGPVLGLLAAGLLVFALAPLDRMAARIANAAVPATKPPPQMSDDERARAYGEAARAAWADGSLSRDERALLRRLQASLGLSEEEAARLEREAEQTQ